MLISHPLENIWVFHFQNKNTSKSWDSAIQRIYEVKTVEGFWRLYSNLPEFNRLDNCSFYLFKKGIKPDWEDPKNRGSGRFLFDCEEVVKFWKFSQLAVIGEMISDKICGVSCNKKNLYNISFWIEKSSEEEIHLIGNTIKKELNLIKLIFVNHSDKHKYFVI